MSSRKSNPDLHSIQNGEVVKLTAIEQVKALLDEMDISTIRQAVEYACEIIKTREDEELAELDRQIAELQAKRQQIRPQSVQLETNGKKREIKALINPKNPEQKYSVGIRPKWLEDWLKETLGDKVSDKAAVYEQIAKWKNEQQ